MAPTLRLTGEDVLFASWPIPVDQLRAVIPESLTVDTYDGTGWVTVLAHEVTDVGVGDILGTPLPNFGEVDLRTYVRHGDESGVQFLSCNTSQPLKTIIGEAAFGLPFQHASIDIRRRATTNVIRSRNAGADGTGRYDVTYRPDGPTNTAPSDSLADFIVERHTYFTPDTDGDALTIGTVERDPWQLAAVDATVRTNTLFETVGLDAPTTEPVFHYSPQFTSLFVGAETVPISAT